MLVEILMAVLLLVVGVLALMLSLIGARHLTSTSEKQDTLTQVGNQALESVLSLPYSQIALGSAPTCAPTDTTTPNYYVYGCPSGPYTFGYTQSSTPTEQIVVDANNGGVTPMSTQTTPGPNGGARMTITIYRYVTWTSDPLCSGCTEAPTNYKRVTIALTVRTPLDNLNRPMYFSSIAFDPCAGPTGQNVSCLIPPLG